MVQRRRAGLLACAGGLMAPARDGGGVEGLLLTILGDGLAGPVVPRRLTLTLHPGTGRLVLDPAIVADAVWRASVGFAWETALRLADRRDADAHLSIAATGPLRGASAGLSVGLLALATLLDDSSLPAHFATGGVRDTEGFLTGGMAAARKAAAAAQLAPQLGLDQAWFFAPPLPTPPHEPVLRVALATDLGSAFARLSPATYERIATHHLRLRRVEGASEADCRGRFALIHRASGAPLPAEVNGIVLRNVDVAAGKEEAGVLLELGQEHLLRWRVSLPKDAHLVEQIPAMWALARACSVP